MGLNQTSAQNVIVIWNSRELLLFNFVRLDILCAWIGPPSEKLWPFELLKSFRCSVSNVLIYYTPESDLRMKSYDHLNFWTASVNQFRESLYVMRQNRTSEWKVMTIWISWEFRSSISSISIYFAPESDLQAKSYDHLNFSRASVVQFRASWYITGLDQTSELKVIVVRFFSEFPFSITSVSI